MKCRCSTETDHIAINHIHKSAFGEEGEEIIELVEGLLLDPTAEPVLSLVAEDGGRLVGHILFTVVKLLPEEEVRASILAPLAVLPDTQNIGVGGKLINEGLKLLKRSGINLVFVLGYPAYYSKFGFKTAGVLGFEAPYPIPAEQADAWMVMQLDEDAIHSSGGRVQCAKTLDQAKYWQE